MRTSKKSTSHTGFIKKMLISMATIVGLTATIVSVPTAAAHADVVQEGECFPAVLMLRGSAEGETGNWGNPQVVTPKTYSPKDSPDTPYIRTNGQEGERLSKLLEAFVNQTDPSKTVSKVRFVGIDYPSLPVLPDLNLSATSDEPGLLGILKAKLISYATQYDESYRTGAKNTVDFIKKDEQRGCNTQYMLVSYSQGVIATRLAIELLGRDNNKILSTYSIGDPFQKAYAAISGSQKSIANTSYGTDGIGRYASNKVLDTLSSLAVVDNDKIDSIEKSLDNYLAEITESDGLIYKNDTDNNVVSRTLCHYKDLVCAPSNPSAGYWIGNFEHHTSYFDYTKEEGKMDVDYDVPAFDSQVEQLADSSTKDPRARSLTSTIVVANQSTIYNVANARPDDICEWDQKSDGFVDSILPCGTYNAPPGTSKMTVKVTDSFGLSYFLESSKKVVDTSTLDKSLNLDSDKWYQFEPYQSTNEWQSSHPGDEKYCLTYWVSDNVPVDAGSWLNYETCAQTNNKKLAEKSMQVFQPRIYNNDGKVEHRIVWGYDDTYAWSKTENNDLGIQNISSDSALNIQPTLTIGPDGKAYYIFQAGKECVSSDEDWHVMIESCDAGDIHQLFTATPVEGQFGALSIERDATAPTKAENVHVTMAKSGTELQWSPSTDGRTDYVDYHIYQKNESTGDYKLVKTTEFSETEYSLSKLQRNVTYTYKVVAVDYAGNESEPSIITFKLPSSIPSVPAAPTLVSTSYPDKSITIKFKNSGSATARVMVWKDSTLVAVTTANSPYTDSKAEQDTYSTYTYQLEVSPNVYTAESNDLTVLLEE